MTCQNQHVNLEAGINAVFAIALVSKAPTEASFFGAGGCNG
jgi:hypothetical protein